MEIPIKWNKINQDIKNIIEWWVIEKSGKKFLKSPRTVWKQNLPKPARYYERNPH